MRAIPALGQNFLVSSGSINKIVSTLTSHKPDTVLEIGPGKGALTYPTAKTVSHLYCVEKDSFLASELERSLSHSDIENVTVYNQDILTFDFNAIQSGCYHIFGSLPYNISKKIISLVLQLESSAVPFLHAVVQREVAEAYTNPPPEADFLYHVAHMYSTCSFDFVIPRTHFKPMPAVDGALITFEKKQPPEDHLERLGFIRNLYKQPRKTIKNNLSPLLDPQQPYQLKHFDRVVDISKRPSTLTHDELHDLFFVYNTLKTDDTEKP